MHDELPELRGRDEECARVDRVLAGARGGSSRVLCVTGEPGIGKTALLRYASERARATGMEVLSARGGETEAHAPFGGLLELLRPALDELERIPSVQADALRRALALGPPAEPFLAGAATMSVLSLRAARRPLLVVLDDAHWLDTPTLRAALFAARRLRVDPVAVILAARTGEAAALDTAGLPALELGALDRRAAAAIVSARTRAPVSVDLVERLTAATGGNPRALRELAGAGTDLDAELLAAGPLRTETSVERAFARRLSALPCGARRALALAAAEDSARLSPIAAAAGELGLGLGDFEPAERAGVVSIARGELTWRHPLLRSAAYRSVAASWRRAMHTALSRRADVDRRAWHLAAATLAPDESVAAALEAAGRRARGRGAFAVAAAAAERAADLSPGDGPRARRLLAAAEAATLGGDDKRAGRVLDEILALRPGPRIEAAGQHLRGQAAIRAGTVMAGHDMLVAGAARIAGLDRDKAVVMLADAAEACAFAGRPTAMLRAARRAWELLPPGAGGREAVTAANVALGSALLLTGPGEEGTARRSDAPPDEPIWLPGVPAEGALASLPLALAARAALRASRWSAARARAEEAVSLARETGHALPLAVALATLASLDARQGRAASCRRRADEALVLAERHGLGLIELWALDARGELELGLARLPAGRNWLERKARRVNALGIADPAVSAVPELVEARVRGGKAEAETVATFARSAERDGRPSALARLARTRGLLAGEHDFEHHFAEALRLHAATRDRFEEARTRLCFGERLRRTGRRAPARDELRAALAAFEALGAAPWAVRARGELAATGERARRRDAGARDELTPQERRVGTLLAAGQTTREAATSLFLSPKTVEYHLRNLYRKLGINSRQELARALR